MNIYTNQGRSGHRSKSRCSYCRSEDHNATQCPHVAEDYTHWQNYEVPLKDPNCWVRNSTGYHGRSHWFINPRYWGEWYQHCIQQKAKQEAAAKRVKTARKRSGERKCGFCGETGHTRRTCGKIPAFLEKVNKANQAYRRHLYNNLVVEHGISVGAVVQIKERTYNYNSGQGEEDHGIGIVTDITFETTNIFSDYSTRSWNRQVHSDLKTPLYATVLIDGRNRKIHLMPSINKDASPFIGYNPNARYSPYISAVVSPSPTPLDEEWVRDGYSEAFEFLVKKKSLEWLQTTGKAESLIDEWYALYIQQQVEKTNESG